MDQLQEFIAQVRNRLIIILLINNLLVIADWWAANQIFKLTGYWLLLAILIVPLLSVSVAPWFSANYLTQPVKLLWQAILHIAPDTSGVPAPDVKTLRIGRELVANLIAHVYQLASVADKVEKLADTEHHELKSDFIANNMPLPLIVMNKDNLVIFANSALLKYIGKTAPEVVGKDVYSILDLSFINEDTLDSWLTASRHNTVTASNTWERVRLNRQGQDALQFDLAAYYNKNNPEQIETMLILFDHTEQYSQDDQALGFIALAVHELRTPLTLLRGYIEALDEELAGKLSGESEVFFERMNASAQQLAAFVNNILNVARIEGDQLELRLEEEAWPKVVKSAVDDLSLRARVTGITIECDIADNLPTVGVDRASIYEVICNLIDNAIKYSGRGKKIVVQSRLTPAGEVETTVQDFGVGIPESIMPNLFSKFYRNHRNRAQIGGTGLGLYLSKAIVSAHGGNIWVRSIEGQGATFGFTVLPYTKLADAQKSGDNTDITRNAHGWIKNHSLYRR